MFGSKSDISLVKKVLTGNDFAWNQLMNRYEKRIYNFSLRMTSNRDDALDLMQEIFISVYKNLPNYRQEAPFPAWLFRIASHRSTDHFRRKKATEPLENAGPLMGAGPTPLADLTRNETNQTIMTLLKQLPEEQRVVVELKFFQDQTFDEMAETLGVSANTLKSRLYAALRKLKTLPEVTHAL